MQLIATARNSVTVISPYLTFPFTSALAAARARGAEVRLITPLDSNKRLVRDYLLWTAERAGFEVSLMPRMTHLKGMVIDGARLIVGSSNFDFVSLGAEEELLAVIEDPAVIADFQRLVIAPAVADALPPGSHRPSAVAGLLSGAALRVAAAAVALTRNAPRGAVDWR